MDILNALKQLRDDIKTWVTTNINALNAKIDEKTIPIDNELSSTSTNPVQNKVIKKAIDNIPKFSGDYNDLTNAPNITEDESGNMVITDESGNIIFKADAEGMHSTAVSINGEAAATEAYVDNAIANIDIPEVDFTGYATEDFVTSTIDSAKEELSESIVSESDEWKVVDEAGNIIFSVDADGAHTTALSLNGESVEYIIDERVASLVDSAPDTLNTLNELAAALGDDPNFATTVATEIGKKVDKVDGKGLSTNDFTDEYKTKLDGLENITFEETDPTVPAWAKEPSKPTYTASEVGLGNVDNVKQYSASNPPPYPVTSVNGKTGAVTLDAAAVGARASTWTPTAANVGAVPISRTVNGKALSSNITLAASDVGAVSTSKALTLIGIDESGVEHTWTIYGVAQ